MPRFDDDRFTAETAAFGTDGRWSVVRRILGLEVASTADVAPEDAVVHDPADQEWAFAPSRLLCQVQRPDPLDLLHGTDTRTVRDGAVLPHTTGESTR